MADSRLKENAAAVKKLFGTAAQLAQKQAALATLNNVTLPKLYHAIGKRIVGLEKLPPDLLPHRDRIRALEAAIATKPEEPATAPAEGFAAKAKQLAQAAAQKASKASSDAAATMQIQAAYVALGKDAVEKYGDKAVPKQLVPELESAKSRAKELSTEIEALGAASAVGFLTPRRAAIAGLCLAALLVAVTARSVGRMVFGGSAPRAQQSSVASKEPSLGLSEKLSAVKEDLERKREEIAAEAKTREVEAREQDLARRERELQEKSRLAESARSPEPRAGTPTTATSAEKPKPRELSPLSPTYPVILAEDFSQINFKAGEFTNRLTRPSSTPVLLPKDLDRSTSRVPRSAEEAVKSYEGELKALMACPRTLSLSIKEPLSDKLYLAYWSGNNCLLQAEGGPLATKSFYIPVTCSHCVSFSLDGTKYENVPLLVMAGKPEENQTARDKALLADLAEKEASLRRAAEWLVYFALLEMPLNKDDVTEDLCSQLLLLPKDAAARDQIVKALHTVGSDTLSNDAPALYYALQCRNPAMITDCFARKQPTNGKEYGKREFLPAGCAMMLTSWFKSMGGKQEQEKVLQTLDACRVDWGVADDLGRTPLVHAILNAQEEAVSYLASKGHGLKSQDKEGRTPLMYAVSGEAETLQPLLTKEAVRGKDKAGNNVLHYCDKFRNPVLPLFAKLVQLGADINAANSEGDTPLHSVVRLAASQGREPSPEEKVVLAETMRGLIKESALAAKNKRGETPLSIATHAKLTTWGSALMFPLTVSGDEKQLSHSVVMDDKRVLSAGNVSGQRIRVVVRDDSGKVVGDQKLDGEVPSLSHRLQSLFGGRDGVAFLRVARGSEERIIALGPDGKQLWETEPYEEMDVAGPSAGGSCVVQGKPFDRPKEPNSEVHKVLSDRLFIYRKNGKREWGYTAGGPLRWQLDDSFEYINRYWGEFNGFVFNDTGHIAGMVSGGDKSALRAVVSFGADGRVLSVIPCNPDGGVDNFHNVRAVLSDGAIVTQGQTNDAEVVVTNVGGKERFRRQLGLCVDARDAKGNHLIVLSLADRSVRLSRLGPDGGVVWEADLDELNRRDSNDFSTFSSRGIYETPSGHVIVSFRNCMAVVDPQGKIVAAARHGNVGNEAEAFRAFEDGTVIWPVASGGFVSGNFKTWLQ
jgi:hypothetical protein